MGVEQHEQPSDAVLGLEGVVVQQPAGVFPAGLGVEGTGGAVPLGCRELQAGQLLLVGPADEVAGLAAMGGPVAGQPGVDVALPAGGQRHAAGGEPVQQRDGGLDVLLDADGLLVGGVHAAKPAAQAPQQVPDGVAVQQLLFVGAGLEVTAYEPLRYRPDAMKERASAPRDSHPGATLGLFTSTTTREALWTSMTAGSLSG